MTQTEATVTVEQRHRDAAESLVPELTAGSDPGLIAWTAEAFARFDTERTATLEREIAALREWRTIDSAPKDGSPIRLFDPEYCDEEMNPSLDGHWSDCADDDAGGFQAAVWNNCQDYFATITVNPTHWRPHPEPPARTTLGGQP